ncbi:MAG: DUF4192 family protein [Rhodoglobus sp.]|nr:DUF4192 family protein [Rhodoglobus sp.]
MTEVIKASTDADFLAMVPTLAGYTATNSLVCAPFVGKQPEAAFRLDLPERQQTSAYRGITAWIIGTLSKMHQVDGVALVIYTDKTFAAEKGVPWLELSRFVSEKLHRQGFLIRGFFCVAADGWANYSDRDYPREGRSLSEIAVDPSIRPISERAALPEVTTAERRAFIEMIVDLCSGYWPSDLQHIDTSDDRAFIEVCATWHDGELPEAMLALLAELSQSNAYRDEIALQFAFGVLVADAVAQHNDLLLGIQKRDGGTMDDVVRREIDAGRSNLDDEFTGLLMGIGRVRTDVDRIERGIRLFTRIVALAPRHYAPNALCIVAWLLWARGHASAAGHYIDQALEIYPDHGMSLLLETMFANGRLPEWTFG